MEVVFFYEAPWAEYRTLAPQFVLSPRFRSWCWMQSSLPVPAKRRVKRKSSLGLAVGLQESSVLEECTFIPLRLDGRERALLAMLKGALDVSEYTDRQVGGVSLEEPLVHK